LFVPSGVFVISRGLYSQRFIFFITYELYRRPRVLHYTWLGRLASDGAL